MSGHNPRRANGHRRNQLRARVLASEDTCGICHLPVDVTLPHGLPGSPEVDEITPVSKGGDPLLRSNVRLAHRLCNQKRGNKDDQPATYTASSVPPQTSRKW